MFIAIEEEHRKKKRIADPSLRVNYVKTQSLQQPGGYVRIAGWGSQDSPASPRPHE